MRRTSPVCTVLLALGCRTGTVSTEPSPDGDTTETTANAVVPVVMVEQEAIAEVPMGFDPSGEIWVDSYCWAWRADGTHLGALPLPQCERWLEGKVRLSHDKRSSATLDGASVRLKGPGVTDSLSCPGCATVEAVAWSPEGDRIALVRDRGLVEVWSVAQARPIAELTFNRPKDDGDEDESTVEIQLAWSDQIHALISRPDSRAPCLDPDEADEDIDEDVDCIEEDAMIDGPAGAMLFTLVQFADTGASAVETPIEAPHPLYTDVTGASLDPFGRCLFIAQYRRVHFDFGDTYIVAQDLAGRCPFDLPATSADDEERWALEDDRWIAGPQARHLSVRASYDDVDYDNVAGMEYEVVLSELGGPTSRTWTADLGAVEPPSPTNDDGWTEVTKRELLAVRVADDEVATVWRHCFELQTSIDDDDDGRSWCTTTTPIPPRCEFVDLAPDGVTILARCGGDGRTLTLLGDQRIPLGIAGDARRVWGDGWLVTLADDSGIVLHDLGGARPPTSLGPVSAWIPATLGPALDRLVLHDDKGLRLIDARSGTELTRVRTDVVDPIHVAFSASGQRLAVTNGTQVTALDLLRDGAAETWAATDANVVAWRQDEHVVFTGPDGARPTQAWDAAQGVPLPKALPTLAPAKLDPAWRWQVLTPHRVRRTIDGLELWFDDDGVLLDDGRFEGAPEALDRVLYRVGKDMLHDPLLTPQQVRPLMEREGLAADFFAGRPIAAGPVMAPKP